MKAGFLITVSLLTLVFAGCSTTTPAEAATQREADAKKQAAKKESDAQRESERRKLDAEKEANRRAAEVQRERDKRTAEAQKLQQKYASYTTPQLRLKRQEIAASIPAYYWGTGIAGAIQAGQIEGKKNEVAEIDRELLRRAESGDTTGQKQVWFMVLSDPPGAKIEADGRFMGAAPLIIHYRGNPGANSTVRATPATLERPTLGCSLGTADTSDATVDAPSRISSTWFSRTLLRVGWV